MFFRNFSKLYFSTLNYRVLYFYFFFLLKVFVVRPCHLFRKIVLLWYSYIVSCCYGQRLQRIRENLTMMRKVKRDCLNGKRFDRNGSCVDMEQCNLQLICWIRGLKWCPIWGDLRGVTSLLTQRERERLVQPHHT